MVKKISIGAYTIGAGEAPFIIAEMSGNHNGSLDGALKIVDAAADAGAQAIKLQTYTADTMTINKDENEFSISDPNSLWFGKTLYKLYQEAYTPWEWHEPIFERARQRGILAFSSAFDASAVDFLEDLNVPCYKIASFENTDLPLISKAASTKKPLIVSLGMANLSEISDIVQTACTAGCEDLILLKCTSNYPANPLGTNLLTIPHLKKMFNCQIGLSDHTLGIGVSIAAVALGATVIEKHVTLSRGEGGVDSAFSLEPSELKLLVEESEKASLALGKVFYGVTEQERVSLVFRRSLYITEDMKAGEILTQANLRSIRPGKGLSPKYYKAVLGRSLKKDVARGAPLSWDLLT